MPYPGRQRQVVEQLLTQGRTAEKADNSMSLRNRMVLTNVVEDGTDTYRPSR